jgi:hypothetical protein
LAPEATAVESEASGVRASGMRLLDSCLAGKNGANDDCALACDAIITAQITQAGRMAIQYRSFNLRDILALKQGV